LLQQRKRPAGGASPPAGEVRVLSGHAWMATSVACSPDGRLALSGGLDRTLRLWDLATGRQVRPFVGHVDGIWSVAPSPDGTRGLSAGQDHAGKRDFALRLWDVATGRQQRLLAGHGETVSSVAFSPDGGQAFSASWDKTVRQWDVAGGKQLACFHLPSP